MDQGEHAVFADQPVSHSLLPQANAEQFRKEEEEAIKEKYAGMLRLEAKICERLAICCIYLSSVVLQVFS